jgi:ATP-dependent helicase HepA
LISFDLPLNPDLLEQRIGRLDRIGQQHTIEIHIPYLLNTTQEKLVRWYHEGINLFEHSCSIGFTLYEPFEEELLSILDAVDTEENALEDLIARTKASAKKMNQALQEGRDPLLELNSCNASKAEALIAEIEAEENRWDLLKEYMHQVFQEYGIDHEDHSEYTEIVHPTDHMKISHFPGLKEEGVTLTYSRAKALVREDIEFLSFEHPMVRDCMELILDSELGNTTLATLSIKSIKPGTLFLESFFTINCAAPKSLQLDRFVPLTPIRILMDASGKNLSKVLSYTQLNQLCSPVKPHLGYPIIQQIHDDLDYILKQSNILAEGQLKEFSAQALAEMQKSTGYELQRLEALKKINPSIRDEEIDYYKNQLRDMEQFIGNATLKLQALRVVINKI